jgi:hypothetical protein
MWNDSRVVGVAVVPKSTADSASGNQHIAHLQENVLVVTERVGPSHLDLNSSHTYIVSLAGSKCCCRQSVHHAAVAASALVLDVVSCHCPLHSKHEGNALVLLTLLPFND